MNPSRKSRFILTYALVLVIYGCLLQNIQLQLFLIRFVNNKLGIILNEHFRSIGLSYVSTFLIFSGVVCLLYFLRLKDKLSEIQFNVITVCLIVFHYFYYLFLNAENYPVYDDQGAILNFLLNYSSVISLSEKFHLIIAPYNESMLIFPKLFVLCWWKIFGMMNFKYLILFNGILLLSLHLFLFAKIKTNQKYLLLVLTVFMFQFQYYDDAFWAISGLCYYGVLVFAALAFYFLQEKSPRGFYLALICSVIATFTFGNGWLCILLCIGFLIVEKNFERILAWTILLVLVLIGFFMMRFQIQFLTPINWNPLDNILFILVLLGSAFQFFYTIHLPVIVGIFIVASFIVLTIKKQYKVAPIRYLLLAFIILSVVTAAPLRSGLESNGLYGLRVRYGIFSILAFTLTLSLLAGYKWNTKKYAGYFIASAFAYNMLTGFFFYPEQVIRSERIRTIVAGIRADQFDVGYSTFQKDDIEQLLKQSIEKGIYKP